MQDKLQQCAKAFSKLLDIQYKIIVGRKGELVEILLAFDITEFVHLAGLHKLTDNEFFRTASRKKVFEHILNGKISYETAAKSEEFELVSERINCLEYLEDMLDSNDIIFKYNSKQNIFSLIQADYLMESKHDSQSVYIFIDKVKNSNLHFCRSFFPKGDKDYTVGQTKYTLLYKEKINTANGTIEIQYNKLHKKL
ncbi:MAG: hypothetical protein HFE51_09875 [Clostridia bacterium]|nr:hypothetical protein [Clostridia bacterium]MCI8979426.1 hypothetical protein [Clostridia bacterium]MCI9086710.1 hypothetical protein [Clostridia bacterium]NDO20313.1 hypothetical protein [Lachnospiraceae bacterium MD329]